MNWLKLIAGFLLLIQALTSDVKIYWSEHNIYGQIVRVLYGSAVEFRCHNKTVDNLYEVSKEEYDNCEPLEHQRSLLNCTRDTRRGRDIYTALIVQHDVKDEYFKDYKIGNSYYFISTASASNRGTDLERISNLSGGRCKYNSMKISLRVVNSLSESTSDPSEEEGADSVPDPGGSRDNATTVLLQDTEQTTNYTNHIEDNDTQAIVEELDQSGGRSASDNSAHHQRSRGPLVVLLLTVVYLLNS